MQDYTNQSSRKKKTSVFRIAAMPPQFREALNAHMMARARTIYAPGTAARNRQADGNVPLSSLQQQVREQLKNDRNERNSLHNEQQHNEQHNDRREASPGRTGKPSYTPVSRSPSSQSAVPERRERQANPQGQQDQRTSSSANPARQDRSREAHLQERPSSRPPDRRSEARSQAGNDESLPARSSGQQPARQARDSRSPVPASGSRDRQRAQSGQRPPQNTSVAKASRGASTDSRNSRDPKDSKDSKDPKDKRKNRIGAPLIFMMVFFVALFAFAGYNFLKEFLPQVQASSEENNLKNNKLPVPVERAKELKADPYYYAEPDFESLKLINKDIIGWLYVKAADVDMPIVQYSDNDYYLSHLYDKKYNSSGAIFMDFRNNKLLRDQNTVIYGHAMKNGSRFGKLYKLRTPENYLANPFVVIKLDGVTYYYQIFSVNNLDANYDYREPEYGSEFMNWIGKLRRNSAITSKAVVGQGDQILTLSTCTNTIQDGRLVVFAVLLNPDGNEVDLSTYAP